LEKRSRERQGRVWIQVDKTVERWQESEREMYEDIRLGRQETSPRVYRDAR